jgi:Fe-S-cluster containining protein
MKKWFKDSLKFSCTQCGKCCTGKGNVYLNAAEVESMSKFLNINQFQFVSQYTREEETPAGDLLVSLKSKKNILTNELGCILLNENNQCSVYRARPTQCRTYPFWPQNLIGESEWRAESTQCEGMRTTSHHDVSSIIRDDEIVTNLIVKMVHAKGIGPDWNYDCGLERH